MVPSVKGGRLLEVLQGLPGVFGARTVIVHLQCIVIEFREVFLLFFRRDPPEVYKPSQNFSMSTSGTDCKAPREEWTKMPFAQIGIVVGEIKDRVTIDFGDRGVGRFKGIIANFDTFILGPLHLD